MFLIVIEQVKAVLKPSIQECLELNVCDKLMVKQIWWVFFLAASMMPEGAGISFLILGALLIFLLQDPSDEI